MVVWLGGGGGKSAARPQGGVYLLLTLTHFSTFPHQESLTDEKT